MPIEMTDTLLNTPNIYTSLELSCGRCNGSGVASGWGECAYCAGKGKYSQVVFAEHPTEIKTKGTNLFQDGIGHGCQKLTLSQKIGHSMNTLNAFRTSNAE